MIRESSGYSKEGSMAGEKKRGWYSKIESREDALQMTRITARGFFVVAAIQAALAFVVGFGILVDASLYVVGGLLVRRFHSRIAALVLLLLALLALGITIANKAGANMGGGSNILLSLVVLWAAIRAVEATFKLHGRFADAAGATQ